MLHMVNPFSMMWVKAPHMGRWFMRRTFRSVSVSSLPPDNALNINFAVINVMNIPPRNVQESHRALFERSNQSKYLHNLRSMVIKITGTMCEHSGWGWVEWVQSLGKVSSLELRMQISWLDLDPLASCKQLWSSLNQDSLQSSHCPSRGILLSQTSCVCLKVFNFSKTCSFPSHQSRHTKAWALSVHQ